jgi:hypothetical protein
MTRLVFVDTETTSLRPDRRAWEIALIVREPGKADVEHSWMIHTEDLDLGNADPMSLAIGRFYDRHPAMTREGADPWGSSAYYEQFALGEVERLTRGAHLVGAVPNFDADVLSARMRANGICPSWHYHLIDVEALMVGWLCSERDAMFPAGIPLPWRSDELSRQCGVEPPGAEDRHTALGDARWARAIYDTVTGGREAVALEGADR